MNSAIEFAILMALATEKADGGDFDVERMKKRAADVYRVIHTVYNDPMTTTIEAQVRAALEITETGNRDRPFEITGDLNYFLGGMPDGSSSNYAVEEVIEALNTGAVTEDDVVADFDSEFSCTFIYCRTRANAELVLDTIVKFFVDFQNAQTVAYANAWQAARDAKETC